MRFSLYLPALLIVIGCNALAQAPQYSVTDLGTLGGVSSFGTAINDLGQVTGDSLTSTGAEHAFLYDGTMHDLGTLNNADAGSISRAWGINNLGQVVGTSNVTLFGSPFAFVYSSGSMHALDGLGRSQAFDINASGQISGVDLMTSQGFLWYNGSPHSLGTGANTAGYAVNSSGQVTGYSGIHAMSSFNGVMTDLGTPSGYTRSLGYGINDLGQIVGQTAGPNQGDPNHPFLYSGTMMDLGLPNGSTSAFAIDINNSGRIVGNSTVAGGATHAFLYINGVFYDVNDLVSPGTVITNISLNNQGHPLNDAGQIAGIGFVDGQMHAVLLSPIPEPAAGSLILLAGLIAVSAKTRRSLGT